MTCKTTNTFEVDAKGFKVQMEEIGSARLIAELVSNSFDEDSVENVKVDISKHGEIIHVTVKDDGNGFRDIKEVYTLFADSYKRTDPTKRGRFNLGEKQFVIACEEASIKSGKYVINIKGDKKTIKTTTKSQEGVTVFGKMRESVQSMKEIMEFLNRIAVPSNYTLTINDKKLEPTKIVKSFKAKLVTKCATQKYGRLYDSPRETDVYLYETDNESAWLYEKGIPVQKLDDHIKWHVDVQQKVPQRMERNIVSAKYLKSIYTAVAENCLDMIDDEDAGQTWVSDALENTTAHTTEVLNEKRYGTNLIAIASTTDSDANEKAIQAGYKLFKGSELNSDIKANMKSNGQLVYAGQEFATSAFEFGKSVPPTEAMKYWSEICKAVALETIDKHIRVEFITTERTQEVASYGMNTLYWNVKRCGGKNVFEDVENPWLLGVLIHELAHDKHGDNNGFGHLSHEYLHEQQRVAGICFKRGIEYFKKLCVTA